MTRRPAQTWLNLRLSWCPPRPPSEHESARTTVGQDKVRQTQQIHPRERRQSTSWKAGTRGEKASEEEVEEGEKQTEWEEEPKEEEERGRETWISEKEERGEKEGKRSKSYNQGKEGEGRGPEGEAGARERQDYNTPALRITRNVVNHGNTVNDRAGAFRQGSHAQTNSQDEPWAPRGLINHKHRDLAGQGLTGMAPGESVRTMVRLRGGEANKPGGTLQREEKEKDDVKKEEEEDDKASSHQPYVQPQ